MKKYNKYIQFLFIINLILFHCLIGTAIAQFEQKNYLIKSVTSQGGNFSKSSKFEIVDLVGQPSPVGGSMSINYKVTSGFLGSLIISNNFYEIEVVTVASFFGDTVHVPIYIKPPIDKIYVSSEFSFSGYKNGLQFIEIDTTSSLIGNAGWFFEVNETDNLLLTAFAGAQGISGEGVLCWLKFAVIGDICTWVPITITSALFNTGEDTVITTDGSVYIKPIPFYGDVDENGLVQAHDAAFILKYLVGIIDTLDCQQFANADVTLDSTVSALDASTILKYVVQLIDSLPWPDGAMLAAGDVSMADDEIAAGQVVEIPLYLNNGDNILSFTGNLDYNPAHLTLTDIVWSPQFADYATFEADHSGEIRFAGAGTKPVIAEGVFATLVFTVNEGFNENETIVSLERLRWNENIDQESVARAKLSLLTGLKEPKRQPPTDFVLEQNYPNPFNPTTAIAYAIPHRIHVQLTIYDVNGREIVTLVNESQDMGWYQVKWDGVNNSGRRASSGVYVMQLKAGNFIETKKIVLMK